MATQCRHTRVCATWNRIPSNYYCFALQDKESCAKIDTHCYRNDVHADDLHDNDSGDGSIIRKFHTVEVFCQTSTDSRCREMPTATKGYSHIAKVCYYTEVLSFRNPLTFALSAGQLCVFSLLHTLISRQDLRNVLHDTTVALPSITIYQSHTPSDVSREPQISPHKGDDSKTDEDSTDLCSNSSIPPGGPFYHGKIRGNCRRMRSAMTDDCSFNTSAGEVGTRDYLNSSQSKGVPSTRNKRHDILTQASKRDGQRQAEETASLPAALGFSSWKTEMRTVC